MYFKNLTSILKVLKTQILMVFVKCYYKYTISIEGCQVKNDYWAKKEEETYK